MCAGAMVHARIQRLVFGARDPKAGAAGSVLHAFQFPHLNHRVNIAGEVLDETCSTVLTSFFKTRRTDIK